MEIIKLHVVCLWQSRYPSCEPRPLTLNTISNPKHDFIDFCFECQYVRCCGLVEWTLVDMARGKFCKLEIAFVTRVLVPSE